MRTLRLLSYPPARSPVAEPEPERWETACKTYLGGLKNLGFDQLVFQGRI